MSPERISALFCWCAGWEKRLDNNDLLRRLRYALRCDDAHTSRLVKLGGGHASTVQVARWRAKEDDADYEPCSAKDVESFLAGLIVDLRGPKEEKEPSKSPWPDRSKKAQAGKQPDAAAADSSTGKVSAKSDQSDKKSSTKPDQVDNNVALKQLRIALSLRSDDVHSILQAGGSAMSASEAGALFRKPDARNFRQCGDQVLRQFIKGLVKRREADEQS